MKPFPLWFNIFLVIAILANIVFGIIVMSIAHEWDKEAYERSYKQHKVLFENSDQNDHDSE